MTASEACVRKMGDVYDWAMVLLEEGIMLESTGVFESADGARIALKFAALRLGIKIDQITEEDRTEKKPETIQEGEPF